MPGFGDWARQSGAMPLSDLTDFPETLDPLQNARPGFDRAPMALNNAEHNELSSSYERVPVPQ